MSGGGYVDAAAAVILAAVLCVGTVNAQPEPGWTSWSAYSDTRTSLFKPRPNGASVAAVGPVKGPPFVPSFRVWDVNDTGELVEPRDIFGEDFLPWDFAWAGDLLLMLRVGPLSEYEDWYEAVPEGNLVVWDPGTDAVVTENDQMFSALSVMAGDGRAIAVTGGLGLGRPGLSLVTVPELTVGAEISTAWSFFQSYGGGPTVLWPHPDESGLFAVTIGEARIGGEGVVDSGFLTFIRTDGELTRIGTIGGHWTSSGAILAPPGITPVDGGRAAAAYVRGKNRKDSLVIYGPEGPIRSYRLGGGFDGGGYPLKLARMDEEYNPWRFIAMAPDGRRALFQKMWDRDPATGYDLRPVWCWDMEADEGYHVADMRIIEEIHGWLNDDAVILGVEFEGSRTHHEYGLLRIGMHEQK